MRLFSCSAADHAAGDRCGDNPADFAEDALRELFPLCFADQQVVWRTAFVGIIAFQVDDLAFEKQLLHCLVSRLLIQVRTGNDVLLCS